MAKGLTRAVRGRQFAIHDFVEAMTWRGKKERRINTEKGGMKI